jgi:aryl-alcohol dehydrogenase-like predicted oxidoreductase
MPAALALGTVQFGMRYGVARQDRRVTQAEAAAIIQRARAAGIDCLDTAVAYGDSESRLGEIGVDGWNVTTKLPPLPERVASLTEWVRDHVEGSLRRLRIPHLDALLLHRALDAVGTHGKAYLRSLNSLKEAGIVRAIGISIYGPDELAATWSSWRPDIVQAPLNVLDRRLETSGWLAKLARNDVRVHTRSVFLQGLLLMPADRRPERLRKWDPILDQWIAWCRERNIEPVEAALAVAMTQPEVERVVVGVDSVGHLERIVSASVRTVPIAPVDLASDVLELIDPSKWRD